MKLINKKFNQEINEDETIDMIEKNIILINCITGDKLGDIKFNILNSVDILFFSILEKLKIYNINSLLINNIAWNPEIWNYICQKKKLIILK